MNILSLVSAGLAPAESALGAIASHLGAPQLLSRVASSLSKTEAGHVAEKLLIEKAVSLGLPAVDRMIDFTDAHVDGLAGAVGADAANVKFHLQNARVELDNALAALAPSS